EDEHPVRDGREWESLNLQSAPPNLSDLQIRSEKTHTHLQNLIIFFPWTIDPTRKKKLGQF
ncbi:hypothetical protein ACJX0J_018870, partial [Zea mays]